MRKQRKIPERMCIGCKERRPKRDLIRVVRSPDREVELDPTGKKSGRGAYICVSAGCLEKARKSKALERALEVTIGQEVWDELSINLENSSKERDK